MSDRIPMTVEQMRGLLAHAKQIGTVDHWIIAAVDWMTAAENEIARLRGDVLTRDAMMSDMAQTNADLRARVASLEAERATDAQEIDKWLALANKHLAERDALRADAERLQRLLDMRPPYYCPRCDCERCGNTRPAAIDAARGKT